MKNIFKNGLVLGIIVLFIGTSIVPMIGAFVNKNEYISNNPVEKLDRSSWWDTDWSYSKKITINHYFVAGDLQNFPIFVHDI